MPIGNDYGNYDYIRTDSMSEFMEFLCNINPMAIAAWDRDGMEWGDHSHVVVYATDLERRTGRLASIYCHEIVKGKAESRTMVFMDNPPRFEILYRHPRIP